MPEFANAFSGLAAERKLTLAEVVRAIRYSIAAEYEAIQLYMQLAESTDDELTIKVLKDIAEEEIVHAGEFLRLLKHLAPEESSFYAEGAEEVDEMIAALDTGTGGEKSGEERAEEKEPESLPRAEPDQPTVGSLFGRE